MSQWTACADVRLRVPRHHPAYSRNYLLCFALPWVWVFTPEQQERGVHAIIAETRRIPPRARSAIGNGLSQQLTLNELPKNFQN